MKSKLDHEEVCRYIDYNEDNGLLTLKSNYLMRKEGTILGYVQEDGTIMISIKGVLTSAHRFIWFLKTGEWPKGVVRHKNENKFDNRWKNLVNDVHHNSVKLHVIRGVAGVCWTKKTERWKVNIHWQDKQYYLGEYNSHEEAVYTRLAAEQCLGLDINHEKSAQAWIRSNNENNKR